MPRRVWLVVVGLTGVLVLAALSELFISDYGTYRVESGFAASHWTWVAVAAGVVLAFVGLAQPHRRFAGVANLIAGVAVVGALAFTAVTTKGRADQPSRDHTCHDGDNPLGFISCGMDKALSVLETKPPPSQPQRWLLEVALGAYIVASGAASMRREA